MVIKFNGSINDLKKIAAKINEAFYEDIGDKIIYENDIHNGLISLDIIPNIYENGYFMNKMIDAVSDTKSWCVCAVNNDGDKFVIKSSDGNFANVGKNIDAGNTKSGIFGSFDKEENKEFMGSKIRNFIYDNFDLIVE